MSDTPAEPDRTATTATGKAARSAAARQRILVALAEHGHDRPELVATFARSMLRRVPDGLLRQADAATIATRVLGAFDSVDRRRPGEVRVDVLRPERGLDGREGGLTVVQVASEDRPFLLATVTDELERSGRRVLRALHPIVGVERDAAGMVTAILPARTATHRESLLHVEVDGVLPPDEDEPLRAQIRSLIADVAAATDDHQPMRERIAAVAAEIRSGAWTASTGGDPAEDPTADPEEVAALLDWFLDGNLVLLGVRDYEVTDVDGTPSIRVLPGSGIGLMRDEARSRFATPVPIVELPDHVRERIEHAPLLTVTRTTQLSTVRRRVRMDYVGLTRRDADGRFVGELRLLGLFTRKGLAEPARTTPVLRRKLTTILDREDIVDGSHDAGLLTTLFQALPKDELFQAGIDTLHRTLVGLLHAEEQREVRTLVRVDDPTRTVSVLVAVPRDQYSPQLRERIQRLLTERIGTSRIDVDLSLGDRNEALARFLLHLDGPVPEVSTTRLQADILRLARSWLDQLAGELRRAVGGTEAARLIATIGERLPQAYRDTVAPHAAVADVLLLDRTIDHPLPLLVTLQADPEDTEGRRARLRVAKRGEAVELSGFIPILESLGLTVIEEIPYRLTGTGPPMHLHDFGVRADRIDVDADGPRVADAVLAAWRGHLEVDRLNELVLVGGLDWSDVSLLRTYRRLRRQFGTAYTPEYVNETIVGHPAFARTLVTHLHARFDPGEQDDETAAGRTRAAVLAELDQLTRLDHDRILRGLFTMVEATLRTNAFRPDAVADGSGEPYVALKIDPSRVPDAPRPVPYREVFVHSPRVEGVHLRAGPVARGGLRWSDRRDDVRAEVLDLVKAQVLKNAVIVPTGAKGGFVLRHEPDDPQELRAEVQRQYVTFIRGLLDVTDDLRGDEVVPPPHVVRHDGDDPYLVVAADRGTATLSDTANAVAARYGFWLGDAFASGGSNGYDHKALGVTARGAWVAVRRHFRELGIDVQTEPTTVVGIGDMSGDVFGNGLLRSRAVKLVAAFDHRDIFLDPDPDPDASFAERQRLYALPRSSWQDYDRSLLSQGGGIYSRSARVVPLPPEVRVVLRVDADELTPPELIRAILTAPVDLLFAGGVGTYVKGSSERHEDVGDRANDELRVDARDLRARVIGEGANLVITQRGRIEYARRGGHVNQDAIDNAAGVATSDHEVNLKILLNLAVEEGRIGDEERDGLLAELADDVVGLVLAAVDRQAAAISREVERSARSLDPYRTLLDRLEVEHELSRDEEVLPDDDELAARAEAGAGLSRPELATLLAWAKRDLKESLLASPVPDDPVLADAIRPAFPPRAVERFGDLLPRHRLRRELIATVVANDLVDRMGPTVAAVLASEMQVPLTDVVRAYRVACTVLDVDRWWQLLDAHEATHPPARMLELEAPLHRLLIAVVSTLLGEPLPADVRTLVARDRPVAEVLRDELVGLGTPDQRRARVAHARWLIDDLVDPELARLIASARDLAMVPDVAQVLFLAERDRRAVDIADAFLRLGDGLGIDRLEDLLGRVSAPTPWARRQRAGLSSDLRRARRAAAIAALGENPEVTEHEAVERFLTDRATVVARARSVIMQAERGEEERLHAAGVAARAVWDAIELLPRRQRVEGGADGP